MYRELLHEIMPIAIISAHRKWKVISFLFLNLWDYIGGKFKFVDSEMIQTMSWHSYSAIVVITDRRFWLWFLLLIPVYTVLESGHDKMINEFEYWKCSDWYVSDWYVNNDIDWMHPFLRKEKIRMCLNIKI